MIARKYSWEGVMQFLQGQVESKETESERRALEQKLSETDSALQIIDAENKELLLRIQGLEAILKQERGKNSRVSHRHSIEESHRENGVLLESAETQVRYTHHHPSKSYSGHSLEAIPSPQPQKRIWADASHPKSVKPITGKKVWQPLASLRSHMDGIFDLVFSEEKSVLASASEDCLVKLWDVEKLDQDPIPNMSLRGHTAPVTSLTEGSHRLFSGGFDGFIWRWEIPERVDVFEKQKEGTGWKAHNDIIWKVSHHPSLPVLLSCGADENVKIWSAESTSLLSSHSLSSTTALWLPFDRSTFVVGQTLPQLVVVNAEKGRVVEIKYQSESVSVRHQANSLAFSPLSSLVAGGHEDKRIRFFDMRSGACTIEIVGHTDAVTSLLFTPSGQQLVSGGNDGSIRTWDVRKFQCVHEMLAHLRKYDEMVRVVAHHSSKPLLASGGADAIVKLYSS